MDLTMTLFWVGFLALVGFFLFLDLKVFNKKIHEVSMKEALIWSGVWVGISLLFNVFVWWWFGHEAGLQFLGGYLLEKSLSVDNLFVIFLIFASFQIGPKYQHRILFWGIIGALVLRGVLILLGTALIAKFHWLFYIFGGFLIYSGIHMFFKKDDDFDPHDSWIVKTVKKFIHVTKDHKDGKFLLKEKGKYVVTIMFVALLVIEFTDLIFAFDSIPAIFGITTDPFIVFTSNIFAILGLRSLYFLIAKIHDSFVFLSYGLAVILMFIGAKMILATMNVYHIELIASLAVVFGILAISIIGSIMFVKVCPHLLPKDHPAYVPKKKLQR